MSETTKQPFFQTSLGRIYCADSLALMDGLQGKSVTLIITSPPFGLVRKKDYGNVGADKYVEFFGRQISLALGMHSHGSLRARASAAAGWPPGRG